VQENPGVGLGTLELCSGAGPHSLIEHPIIGGLHDIVQHFHTHVHQYTKPAGHTPAEGETVACWVRTPPLRWLHKWS